MYCGHFGRRTLRFLGVCMVVAARLFQRPGRAAHCQKRGECERRAGRLSLFWPEAAGKDGCDAALLTCTSRASVLPDSHDDDLPRARTLLRVTPRAGGRRAEGGEVSRPLVSPTGPEDVLIYIEP